jgi:hypothetical protein
VLAGSAVLLVGAAAVTAYYYFAARGEVAAAVAETDRLDPGWRFEDLEAQRRLPPAERNSALHLLKVESSIPHGWSSGPAGAEADDVLRDLPPERQLDDGQVRRFRADLARAGPARAQARKLADMPEGRFPVTWSPDIITTTLPWMDGAQGSTRPLLQLDALLRDHDGDPDGALVSARALLNIGRSLGDEPFYYAPCIRSQCRQEAVRAVERTLGQGQPSEGALAEVQESLAGEDAVPLPLLYFRGQRALMHVFLTRVDEGHNRISEIGCVPTHGLGAHAETWLGRPHALHKHACYLRDMNEAVEIARLPLERQHPLYREWRRRKGFVENVGDAFTLGDRRDEDRILSHHALLRCGLAGVAAERYRRERGDWPAALADLVPGYLPAVPLDPFDGEPLRYRRTAGGAVIYSFGEDGRDDGGDRTPPPGEHLPRDVVFTLWDVAGRRQPPAPPGPAAADGKEDAGKD